MLGIARVISHKRCLIFVQCLMCSLMSESLPTFCWQTLFNLVTWRVKSDSCHFCFSGRHFLFAVKPCENNWRVDGRDRSFLHSFKLQILFEQHHGAGLCVRDLETRARATLSPETRHPVRCIRDICPAADAFLICSVKRVSGSSWPVLSFHLSAGGRLLQSQHRFLHHKHLQIAKEHAGSPRHLTQRRQAFYMWSKISKKLYSLLWRCRMTTAVLQNTTRADLWDLKQKEMGAPVLVNKRHFFDTDFKTRTKISRNHKETSSTCECWVCKGCNTFTFCKTEDSLLLLLFHLHVPPTAEVYKSEQPVGLVNRKCRRSLIAVGEDEEGRCVKVFCKKTTTTLFQKATSGTNRCSSCSMSELCDFTSRRDGFVSHLKEKHCVILCTI